MKKIALITGISLHGSYLSELLLKKSYKVHVLGQIIKLIKKQLENKPYKKLIL